MKDLVVGLDCSTTAAKAIVWDARGNVVQEGRAPIALQSPRPGWYEQSSAQWWSASAQALADCARGVEPGRLAGLCLTHQRETFVALDAAGEPLLPAIVWMDERATAQVETIAARYGRERIHAVTGKPACVTPSLYKILWLRDHERATFDRATFADVHAVLALRLTGALRTSIASADPMGLVDLARGDWDDELLAVIGLERARLPALCPAGALLGTISPAAAASTGLPEGLPVIAGGGDGQVAALGAGIVDGTRAYVNLGTALVAGVCSSTYRTSPTFRTLAGGAPGTFILESDLKGGAFTIEWFRDRFGAGAEPERLDEGAAAIAPGAGGLVAVPYWAGVMNPYWDDAATGIVVGWTGAHGPAHLYRAILEGLCFEQRLALDGIESATGEPIGALVVLGGGAQSRLWCQILADVTGRRVLRSRSIEATCLGAGVLAAVGVGIHASIEVATAAMTGTVDELAPGQDGPAYERLYREVYRALYPALREPLARLARFRAGER